MSIEQDASSDKGKIREFDKYGLFLELSDESYSSDDENNQEKINELKARIQENEKDWDAYIELIQAYRCNGDIDNLRSIRLQCKQVFPLPSGNFLLTHSCADMWIQWIDDEKQFVSDEEEKQGICNLYQAALRDYYSADVWYQYLSFVKTSLPSDMPSLLEEAVSAFEYDCIDGPRLWDILLEWSKSANPAEQTEKLYSGMLGNCYETSAKCLESYKQWHEEIDLPLDPSVVEIGENSIKEFEKRSVLQMELTASIEVDHITTALRRFFDYTKFELQNDKKSGLSRTGFLYQRYAYTFRNLSDFWNSYFLYVYDNVKIGKKCNQVVSRALRHLSNSGPLYEARVICLELTNKPVSFLTELTQTVNQQGLGSYYEYLRFYLACLASFRRRTVLREEGAESALRAYCGSCIDWLVSNFLCCFLLLPREN